MGSSKTWTCLHVPLEGQSYLHCCSYQLSYKGLTAGWEKKEFIGLDLIFCQPKNYCSSIGKRSHHAKMGLTKGCKFWVSPETHSIFCLLLHHKRMVSSVVVKKSNGNQDEKNSQKLTMVHILNLDLKKERLCR